MKKVICFLLAVLMAAGVVSSSLTVGDVLADTGSCEYSILGMKPWYAGLELNSDCSVKSPANKDALPKFVWTIVGNVAYDVMLVVGVVAVGFIIYGGYMFMIAGGDPGKVAKAKNVLTAAVIGLLVSVLATVIINLIMGVINVGTGTS